MAFAVLKNHYFMGLRGDNEIGIVGVLYGAE